MTLKINYLLLFIMVFVFIGCTHSSTRVEQNINLDNLDHYSKVLNVKQSNMLKVALEARTRKSLFSLVLSKQILYIRLDLFHKFTDTLLYETIVKYPEAKGLIIDLRDNPGGLLKQAIKISDYFLDNGMIVKIQDIKRHGNKTYYADNKSTLCHIPLCILVNKKSASASEIFAGALQVNKRAIIVGEKTFGKGTVQDLIPFSKDKIFKLTTAKYYLSNGKSIEGKGIVPNIEIVGRKIRIHDISEKWKDKLNLPSLSKVDKSLFLAHQLLKTRL